MSAESNFRAVFHQTLDSVFLLPLLFQSKHCQASFKDQGKVLDHNQKLILTRLL